MMEAERQRREQSGRHKVLDKYQKKGNSDGSLASTVVRMWSWHNRNTRWT